MKTTILIEGKEFNKAEVIKDINLGDIRDYVFDYKLLDKVFEIREYDLILKKGTILYYGKNPYCNAEALILNFDKKDEMIFDVIFDNGMEEYLKYIK